MTAAQIAETLEGLYLNAYALDADAITSDLGMTPTHRKAKRRLDLWIAAIDQRAYEDRAFLDRLRGEGRIGWIMALSSSRIDPSDRADAELLIGASTPPREASEDLLKDVNADYYERLLDWLDEYTGERVLYEEPFWISRMDFDSALSAFFGREEAARMQARAFPRGSVDELLRDYGLKSRYETLKRYSNDQLVAYLFDLSLAVLPGLRPMVARDLARENVLASMVLHERGLNPQSALERLLRDELLRLKWNADDVDNLIELERGNPKYTASRLDDYHGRHVLLEEYRRLYEQILSRPMEETFSPEHISRLNVWNNLMFNRSLGGFPVSLAELDAIRLESVRRYAVQMGPITSGFHFELRDRNDRLWLTPTDLGLCGSLVGGPMTYVTGLRAGGRSLDDLVCNNIEFIAFLPPDQIPEHAAASAFGVFGIVVAANPGPGNGVDWTPGSLATMLSHEAAHNEFFRENFETEHQRLILLSLNERRAYATGLSFQESYLQNGVMGSDETAFTGYLQFNQDAVILTNRRLGVPEGERDPFYWRASWDVEPFPHFIFQPGELASEQGQRVLVERFYGPLSGGQIRAEGDRVLKQVIAMLSSSSERRQALEALRFLESNENNGESHRILLKSNPLTRVVNALRQNYHITPPMLMILDTDQAAWFEIQDAIGRASLIGARMNALQRNMTARPQSPNRPHLTTSR